MHATLEEPLRNHALLRGEQADELHALMNAKGFDADLVPRSDRPVLRPSVNAIELPALHVCYLAYGSEAVVRAPSDDSAYRLHFSLGGSASISAGGRTAICTETQAVLTSPMRAQTTRSSAECRRLIVIFDQSALRRHLSALLGEGVERPLEFTPQMDCGSGYGRSLRNWLSLATDELDCDDSLLHNKLATTQLEQLLLTGLLFGQPHTYSGFLQSCAQVAPRSVKRAIAFIHDNLRQPIGIAELVVASGTPGRTLFKHFRAATGLSPLAYVRKLRFERVRTELMRDADVPVSRIAADWGFTHMGRFAEGYRELFGEVPSASRRRR
jgi:AraC-like DNA-binding protein